MLPRGNGERGNDFNLPRPENHTARLCWSAVKHDALEGERINWVKDC